MIKFGPSGNSLAFAEAGKSKSEESAVWVKEKGLSCFEYSFGRGVNLTTERAISIGNAFKSADVEISVHAPYYINFANPDDEMAEKSYTYVLQSAEKVKLMQGKRVVFHPASQGKMKPFSANPSGPSGHLPPRGKVSPQQRKKGEARSCLSLCKSPLYPAGVL